MSSIDQQRLAKAADTMEITQCVYAYSDATDRGDFDTVLECFHPDGQFQYQQDGTPVPVKAFFEAQGEAGTGFKETMHHASNVMVRVNGDKARAQTYVLAHHIMKEDCPDFPPLFPHTGSEYGVFIGARYVDDFERRNGEWKISLRKLTFEWSTAADASLVSGPLAMLRGNLPSELGE